MSDRPPNALGARTRTPTTVAMALLLAAAMALTLTGCFTGKRPSFSDDPFAKGSPTGDEQVDAVLARLDATAPGPLTATYDVLTKFGNTTHAAIVRVQGTDRAVTIGDVEYLQTAS